MKFSVATPVFNGMPWLRCCLASVMDQALPGGETGCPSPDALKTAIPIQVEHLVQDGGSTDCDLQELARQFGGQYSTGEATSLLPVSANTSYELQVFTETDTGMYDAINRAWRRATGDIISYLNADEQYLPGTLDRVGRFFIENPRIDLVFGDALLLDPEGNPVSYRRVVKPSRAHTRAVHLSTLSCAMFFRRRLLDDGFFFNPKWRAIGDAEWVWRVLGAGVKTGVIHEPLAAFSFTGENLGATASSLQEAQDWKNSGPVGERMAVPALRALHWLKKAAAGAYGKQAVALKIFTCKSPAQRILVQNSALTSGWPKTTKT